MSQPFGYLGLGAGEAAMLALIAFLLFGRTLPGIARYLGRSAVELTAGRRDSSKKRSDDEPNAGEAGAPVPRPSPPKPPCLDVRLAEPESPDERGGAMRA